MSKTIKEWLSELPSPYREQALENVTVGSLSRGSLKDALMISFTWEQSPEGFDYWDELYETLEIGGK